MDLRQLTYFLAIAEEGQITAAARRLNMAQPPLSQQMKALEEELGVELFQREPRSVTLTDAGEILYRRARQLITLADSTRREIGDFKSGLRGTLSIGTVSSSGSVILRPALRQFHDSHRGIRFEIYDGNTFHILDMLRKGLIEIGIVRTPFKQEAFDCTFFTGRTDGAGLCRKRSESRQRDLDYPRFRRSAPHRLSPLQSTSPRRLRRL